MIYRASSRKQALVLNERVFYTGIPCKYGHISERLTYSAGVCAECLKARAKRTRHRKDAANGHRMINKESLNNYLKKYNITFSDYALMLAEQNYSCAICNKIFNRIGTDNLITLIGEPTIKRDTCIDHCHMSMQVRGILCSHCNSLLGHSMDDIRILKNAIGYLTRAKEKPLV